MRMQMNGWLVIALLLGTLTYALAEEITLTTYYPSPRGVYDELRTAGNVQIGNLTPPGDIGGPPTPAPRLYLYRERDTADSVDIPLLVVEDQRPSGANDPTPFIIDEQGNVGIGTVTSASSKKLEVAGDIRASGNVCGNGGATCLTTCPGGMADAGGYCIDPSSSGATTWPGAALTCFDAGKELCSSAQWLAACVRGLIAPESNWVADWGAGPDALYFGDPSNCYAVNLGGGQSIPFRCCRSK